MSPIYEALDPVSYQIRLLYLHPDTDDAVIRCDLEKASLTDGHRFVALSYEWGNEAIVTNIVANGVITSVRENLQKALKQLRSMKVEQVWADALCINQSDNTEKSLQVRIMKHIYSAAHKTFAWLGESGSDGAAVAIARLRTASLELSYQSGGIIGVPQEYICARRQSSSTSPRHDVHTCHCFQLQSTFRDLEDLFN